MTKTEEKLARRRETRERFVRDISRFVDEETAPWVYGFAREAGEEDWSYVGSLIGRFDVKSKYFVVWMGQDGEMCSFNHDSLDFIKDIIQIEVIPNSYNHGIEYFLEWNGEKYERKTLEITLKFMG